MAVGNACVNYCHELQEGEQMPEDWRTLVDAHLYSINTSMVPEVVDLLIYLLHSVETSFDLGSQCSCWAPFHVVALTLTGKSFHLVTVLPIKRSNSKLHGAVPCCAVLCYALCNAL